ncbi:hypothetical protein PRI8871_00429 [Pseudoprimorskyibacter insulae]|uniref:Uncharacterized protein n=1 Tax=Pseudoprimorskyibacter insulae TaxID=1695997 RepID=A0A2R8AP79_9RHOB|nr:hypothetical protein PRI8871_00429 [Pseudoprimorskyibacter insulae]
MRHDWILDVLTDLRTFAGANGLPDLAQQLDLARTVAAREAAVQGQVSAISPPSSQGGPM